MSVGKNGSRSILAFGAVFCAFLCSRSKLSVEVSSDIMYNKRMQICYWQMKH